MKFEKRALAFLVIIAISGCSGVATKAKEPLDRELGKEYNSLAIKDPDEKLYIPEEPRGNITLETAIRLALMNNPSLGSFSLEIRANEAAAYQASLNPNPQLTIGLENFAGSGSFTELNSSETTISLGQMILLAGKIDKRTRVANLESEMSMWNYESRRLDVFTAVTTAYIKVISTQETMSLNNDLLTVAKKFLLTIERRVKAGQLSPSGLSRARVELARAEIVLTRSIRANESAKIDLAATWGTGKAYFDQAEGELEFSGKIPSLELILKEIEKNPDLKRWGTEFEKRKTKKELAEANGIPDINIKLGFRHFSDFSVNALVAEIDLPIPVFDANQGAVQEAGIRLNQTHWEKLNAENYIKAKLGRLYLNMIALEKEVMILKASAIPEAKNAYTNINDGYEQGKYEFLDVLSAQRALYNSKATLISALAEYQISIVEIERLIGQPLGNFNYQ